MVKKPAELPKFSHPESVELRSTPPSEHRPAVLDERRRAVREMSKMAIEFKKLHEKAYTDDLTGLGNRRSFYERFPQLFKYAQTHNVPIALVFADVRGLKRTNDAKNGGHGKGDELLKAAATAFKDLVREDDIVARLGGDEFGAVLLGYTPAEGETQESLDKQTVERLSGSFESQAHEKGIPDELHVGLDVAIVTMHGHNTHLGMLHQADEAMHALKDQRYADLAAQGVVFADSRLQT